MTIISWIFQTYSSYKDASYWRGKKRNSNPTRQGLWLKSGQQIDRADGVQTPSGNDGEEDSSPLDLSLESFPLLQGTTKSPSEISRMGYSSSSSTFGFPSRVAHKQTQGASPSLLLSTQEAIVAGEKELELAEMNSQKGQELQKITEETYVDFFVDVIIVRFKLFLFFFIYI